MIYSLNSDTANYSQVRYNNIQIIKLFGRENLFPIKSEPKEWLPDWQEFDVTFVDSNLKQGVKPIPDISESGGRLFMTEKTKTTLEPMFKRLGEFLPIRYENGRGYFFNPLKILCANEQYSLRENLQTKSIVFDNQDFPAVFRTDYDGYKRVFCIQDVRRVLEVAGLNGVTFEPDLANVYIDDDKGMKPTRH